MNTEKKIKIIFSFLPHRSLVGIIEDDEFVEFLIEQPGYKPVNGNIYLGIVKDTLPALQSAFIDIGFQKPGFLHINEIIDRFSIHPEYCARQPIEKLLKKGDRIIVQVLKESYAEKGPQLTTKLSLPGKFSVFLPARNHKGISHKITDENKRAEIIKTFDDAGFQDCGYVIRSAAETVSADELIQELSELRKTAEEIEKFKNIGKPFELLFSPNDIFKTLQREYLTDDCEIYYDSPLLFDILKTNLKQPEKLKLIYKPLADEHGIFNIFSEYKKALRPKVWLKCGGHMCIEQTEAFVSVDINTGKNTGDKITDNLIFETNAEALIELARQIRLRNISGIIIVDIMNMLNYEQMKKLIKLFEDTLKFDKAKCTLYYTPETGILQILRRRNRKSISQILLEKCDRCYGYGKIHTIETQIINIEQTVRIAVETHKNSEIILTASKELNDYIINNNIKEKIEELFNIKIMLIKNENYSKLEYEMTIKK